MELSSRQIVALAAPLVVTYLTYSTLDKGAQVLHAAQAVKAATAAASKSSGAGVGVGGATRDPFAPAEANPKNPASVLAAALLGQSAADEAAAQAEDEAELPLRLDGTVITARWRFAILNGDRVVEGQVYQGLTVDRIEAERIVLSGGGETISVDLEIARYVEPEPVPAGVQPGLGGLSPLGPAGAPDILQALGIPKG